MYRILQSFKPGEVTPEQANRIGYELAMRFTGGKHQFIVATHTDKAHIHTHIEFNSVNLDGDGKFKNVKGSALVLRRLNDELCRENGLSVIEHPARNSRAHREQAAIKYGNSFKERLRQTIDRVLPASQDYEDFLAKMRAEGYEVKKDGGNVAFRGPAQERFTRSYRLGDNYTLDALHDRCAHRRGQSAENKAPVQCPSSKKINLLIDIQAKLDAGKGVGYERWVKIFNLKEAAKTLNFLIENNLTDYDELTARAERAGENFDASSERIKRLEARLSKVKQLKTHIFNYSKTHQFYAAYKKSRHKKEFLERHGEEIAQHEAAKKAFDALNGKPIPKVAQLSDEYAKLLAEKQAEYERYKAYRQEMLTYETVKQNVDWILGAELKKQKRQMER